MKLLLTSAGITTQEIANKLAELCNKPLATINVAVILEASAVEPGDKSWLITELTNLRNAIGGDIDFINILALDMTEVEERIAGADVLYVIGGNPDYLVHIFKQTSFTNFLTSSILHNKVYVGSSAGSMVLGHRGSTDEYQRYYGESRTFNTTEYFNIADFVILPHFESTELPNRHKETLINAASKENQKIYAIKDTQAIAINDGVLSFCGGKPYSPKSV